MNKLSFALLLVGVSVSAFHFPSNASFSSSDDNKDFYFARAQNSRKFKDSDKDFLTDSDEIKKFKTDPKKKDSDEDGILDGDEDSDGDSIPNEDEDDRSKSRAGIGGNADSDKDGLDNEDEDEWGLSPRKKDTDRDKTLDGNEDGDQDGIANEDEDDRPKEKNSDEDSDDKKNAATPTPGGLLPTPTSTTPPSTPTATSGNFDGNGNVTAAGKSLFGIPSSLSANISSGQSVWSKNCQGCHSEKTNRTFSTYKSMIAASPMFITLPDSEVAHLTAYLNRFRK